MDGPIHQADSHSIKETKKTSVTKTLMKKYGALLTPIKTLFHGNTEEMKKLIQPTDMTTHQADLLLTREIKKIFLTRTSMKKSTASSTPTKTPSHGNTEETKRLTQPTDGLTHQADSLLTRETKKISQTRTSMRRYGASLMPTKTLFHGNTEETRRLIQPTAGLTHQADSLLIKRKVKIFLTRTSTKKFGALLTPTKIPSHGNTEEMRRHIQLTDMTTHQVDLLLTKISEAKSMRPVLSQTFMISLTQLLNPLTGSEIKKPTQQTVVKKRDGKTVLQPLSSKLNSLETQKNLALLIQLHIKLRLIPTQSTVVFRLEELPSIIRNTESGWVKLIGFE